MGTDGTNKHGTYKCVVRFEKRILFTAQLLAAAALCIGLCFSVEWYWLVLICLPFEVASIAILWWPVIEPTNGVLREQALLFSRIALSERITPLKEFTEIFYRYTPGDVGDSDYRLGLRHRTGRKVWVAGCWQSRRSIEEKAWEISCNTGIKLKEWQV